MTSGSSTEYKDGRHESTSKVVFDLMMKTDKKQKENIKVFQIYLELVPHWTNSNFTSELLSSGDVRNDVTSTFDDGAEM